MRVLAIATAAGLALASFIAPANAAPLSIPGAVADTGTASMLTQANFTVRIGFGGNACPEGTHLGYEGKYCWPDHGHVCPIGTHLGYEGKYCWKN
jgi:hypothetical protein